MDEKKMAMSSTTDGKPPRPGFEDKGAPAPINPVTGQHEAYWVLSEAERAKGFVRPVRSTYRHVGEKPVHPVRDLTPEEVERFGNDWAKFEAYPKDHPKKSAGKFWTQAQLDKRACGTTTSMGRALAETYAASPGYYGSTFCCACGTHFPVAEFVWEGTQEKVGS